MLYIYTGIAHNERCGYWTFQKHVDFLIPACVAKHFFFIYDAVQNWNVIFFCCNGGRFHVWNTTREKSSRQCFSFCCSRLLYVHCEKCITITKWQATYTLITFTFQMALFPLLNVSLFVLFVCFFWPIVVQARFRLSSNYLVILIYKHMHWMILIALLCINWFEKLDLTHNALESCVFNKHGIRICLIRTFQTAIFLEWNHSNVSIWPCHGTFWFLFSHLRETCNKSHRRIRCYFLSFSNANFSIHLRCRLQLSCTYLSVHEQITSLLHNDGTTLNHKYSQSNSVNLMKQI